MRRRILSFVLVLAMVLSFAPVFAVAAEEEVKASPKAGTHTTAHKCEECDSTAWTPWTSGSELPTEGHYVLMNNITLSGEITMTGDLHICLNGYVITGKGDKRLIGTKKDADTTLVITDCTAYTEDEVYHAGALTGGVDTSTGGGGAIFVRRGGTCKVYDGRITGNIHKNDSAGGGAFLLQAKNDSYDGGKLYMYGGEISNNKAVKANGTTTLYGGAIYANTGSYVELENVTISGNTGSRGGAIYATGSTIQLKNTVLKDNVGGSGTVGLYSKATLTTDNVTFTGNTTTNGSAICGEGSTTATLKDTTITGNTGTSTTGSRSAAIYVNSTTVKLIGKTVIHGNTTQGATIPDVVLDTASYDTLQIHELTEGSRVVFATPKTEPVEASEVIALDTAQTTPWQLGWVRFMTPSGSLKDIGLQGTEFVFGTYHYHGEQVYTPLTEASQLEAGGHYYLAEDVTLDKLANLQTKDLNLEICLNGHDLKPAEGKQVMYIGGTRNITVTIDDCTAYTDGNGVYHAGAITGADNTANGGAIYVGSTDTLHLKNGRISGNQGGNGGAVIVFGTFRISGGELSDNKATKSGGAIYVNKNTVGGLIMTGGTIRDNSATTGGAVFVGVNTAVELGNVTVTGNTATAGGGGLSIADNVTVKLTGTPRITDNTVSGVANNLRLAGGTMLQLEDLADKASVGITLYERTGGTLHFAENVTKDVSACFSSDDTAYVVGYEDNKLLLQKAFTHSHCLCGDSTCTEHTQVTYLPWYDATSVPTSGSYCLMTDVTVEETVSLTNSVDICLNGHTITQKSGSKAQMYKTAADAGVTLTISDCTAKTENGTYTAGKITGFVSTTEGSVMYLRLGTTLELFDGIIENNNGGSGGAILINGEFKMYGGQFVGNRAGTAESGKNGGALYLNKDAVATITGGAFLNNSAKVGGAIYSMGHITVKDTVFTGNTADEGGAMLLRSSSTAPNTSNAVLQNVTVTGNTTTDTGAVYLLSSLGSLTLRGNVQIYGNTGKNLYLPKDYLFSAEEISTDAKVGVTAQEMGEPISNPCDDYTANFISDNTKLQIIYKDGALYLDAAGNHKHCFCAGESTYCDHAIQTFVEWDDPTSLPTSGNYFLSVDVELPDQLYLENTELNLCLNGHTVTLKTRMFYPKGETTLRILDCTDAPGKITGGTKSAILVDKNSTVDIELWNGIFTGNEGETAGGAILLQGNSTLMMYGGKITGNAVIGRLVTDKNGNVLLKEDGSQQYVGHRGGGGVGVYGENTRFYMYGGEITGNKATSVVYLKKNGKSEEVGGDGGGVYVYKGSAWLYGGTITGNNAQLHGGGVFTSYGKLEIDGGTISGNITDGGAGGVYASTGSAMVMKSGKVVNNQAKSSGGGIVAQGVGTVFTLAGGEVSGNQSKGSAAGVLTQGKAEMVMTGGTVKGNVSQANGGGIYISTKSKLTMTGGSVTGNAAKNQGGGMYLNKATSRISGAYIGGNTAKNNTAGGIRVAGGTLTISGCQIVDNYSKTSGCGLVVGGSSNTENGVKVNYYATAYISGCSFRGNETEGSASGLLLQSVGTNATVSGCTFTGNVAKGSGGGMYVSKNVTATIKNSKFLNNTAAAGGGFRLNYCKVTMEGITIGENSGGGAYIYGVGCEADLKDFTVYGNTAGSGAGVLFNSGAKGSLENAQIYENIATKTAGGFYVGSRGQVVVKDLDIHHNQGTNAGGVYCGAGAVVVAENLNIYENKATALGGGIYNGANLTVRNSVIRNNTAAENGGGIHTWKSSARWTADDAGTKLINCQIFGNSASGQGGGVFVHRGGPIQMTDVTVEDNTASMEGGGIYCDGRMDLTDVQVRKNTSGGAGYAVYLTPAEYDGRSYFSGYKNIAGNTVIEENVNGDLYLAEGIAVAISGATLGNEARIHVTLSDGVLTQRVVGVYHYEGENLSYVLTAGDRSITEPMAAAADQPEQTQTQQKETQTNTWLYILVGVVAVIAVGAVLLVVKKKKTAKAKQN